MKPLKNYFLYVLLFVGLMAGCQQEDLMTVNSKIVGGRPAPGDFAPNPPPPPEITQQEFAGATSWLIEWHDPDLNNQWDYKRFFSTGNGSLYTIGDLNASAKATAIVDMDLLFGFVRSPDDFSPLIHYQNYARSTQFKPSDLTPEELSDITQNNPALFEDEFENNANLPTAFQPYNYEANGEESALYQNGEAFSFKTDQTPPMYGVVRIEETSLIYQGIGPRIIEVIVQKDGIGWLSN